MTIIDLDAERNKREQPEPQHVYVDEKGQTWYQFQCSYQYEDQIFSFRIWARDFVSADHMITAMKKTVVLEGQVMAEFEA